ncbi:MAG TPA: ABC transporter permease [Tepidisphaeraceae bacterium]
MNISTPTAPAVSSAPSALDVVRIEPQNGWQPLDLREFWRYRELLGVLAMRDLKVRYKQTALGAAWAIIQPVLTMIVFTIFFGKLGGMAGKVEGGVPYYIYVFCALLPWQLFAGALTNAGNSLIGSQNLITKVYFPRLVIPISAILSGLVDFAIAFIVLIILMIWAGIVPGIAILTLPLFVLMAFTAALAVGLWLSALNVEYRDVRYVIPFLTQFWMFLSPIAYPSSIVPEQWRWLYGLNPMAGVVEGFRWALLGNVNPPGAMIWVSAVMTILLLIGGAYYFRRMEENFADRV